MMLVQRQYIQAKLLLLSFSLLLLSLVAISGPLFQEGLAASDTHIAAVGDWRCSEDTQKTVQNVISKKPQLLLGLGDYGYPDSHTCWFNMIKPISSIMKIGIGNHEADSSKVLKTYMDYFGLSKQFYSFDINNIHVLTMSSEDELEMGSEQYNFVISDLRRAANNPDIKWIIVTFHTPFYTSPNDCNASRCEGNEEAREIYHPLFDKYGVDLVLSGHVHTYQRSVPLQYNAQSPSDPLAKNTGTSHYNNPEAPVFTIVGTGGSDSADLEEVAPFMVSQHDSMFGLLDISLSENKLDAKFVTNDGQVLDQFSIEKTAKKKVIERISDTTDTNTGIMKVSDKKSDEAKSIAKPAQDDKSAISFKLDDDAAYNIAKPLAQVENDKPSITFKLDEETTEANTNSKLAQIGKSSITFKLDDEATAASTNSKADPLAGQEVQEVKPAMTPKLDDSPPKDNKPMLLSKEQIKQGQKKPAVTTKLDDSPTADDKPITLSEETSGKDKSATLSNSGKSNVKELGTEISSNVVSNENSEERTDNTNLRDPFTSLN